MCMPIKHKILILNMIKKNLREPEARQKLERYCIYQERCHQEVWEKLYQLGANKALAAQVITHLIEYDFLNETRFACSFARGKFNQKKWGKNRIILELKRKGVSIYNCNKALKEIDESDYETTFTTLFTKRKIAVQHYAPLVQKRKIMDYLLYRGWEKERIYEALQKAF